MNETVIQPVALITSVTAADGKYDLSAQKCESIMGRLVDWLAKAQRRYSISDRHNYKHQSFIEQNLLDKNIGPEISRTLR